MESSFILPLKIYFLQMLLCFAELTVYSLHIFLTKYNFILQNMIFISFIFFNEMCFKENENNGY